MTAPRVSPALGPCIAFAAGVASCTPAGTGNPPDASPASPGASSLPTAGSASPGASSLPTAGSATAAPGSPFALKLTELHRVHLAKTRGPAGKAGTFGMNDLIMVRIANLPATTFLDMDEKPIPAMFLNDQACRPVNLPLGAGVTLLCPPPAAGAGATLWLSPPTRLGPKSGDIPRWMDSARKSGTLLDLSATLAAAPQETFADEDEMIRKLPPPPAPGGKP